MSGGRKLLAIVGPTATGKTALAVSLAREFDSEIISADSRQVYRYMDIGTAKPSMEQRKVVPHHLIDVVDPDEEYSLALFLRQARTAIQEIRSRSKLPILAGGTGQYVWALLEGWQAPAVPPDPGLRHSLEKRADTDGAAALHKELARVDPERAGRIDARNVRRVVRALEVHYASPDSLAATSRKAPAFEPVVLGLTLERVTLYQRADRRVDAMIEGGWVAEVEELLLKGYGPDMPSMSSLGYKELAGHLGGEITLDEAVAKIKLRTHRLVRQQYAWFRHKDERIRWFQTSLEGTRQAAAYAREVSVR